MIYSRLPHRANADGSSRSQYIEHLTKRLSKAACRGPEGIRAVLPELVGMIADQRNLYAALAHIRREGGRAPGPDGLRIDDLTGNDAWALIRNLRDAILAGTYRHGPVENRKIPKPAGRGYREITLKNLRDRIVARAIAQPLAPLLNASFHDTSYCVSGRGQQVAIADALNLAEHYMLNNWVVADIADAFGSVPTSRLRDILAQRLPDGPLLNLIDRVLAGNPNGGLAQGCGLSMLLLNLYLDHFLDQKWRRQAPQWPLLRYVDDLLVMCSTPAEAREANNLLRKVVREIGLKLKGDERSDVRDLAIGERADWLGLRFDLTNEGVRVRLPLDEEPGGFWATFEDRLLELHDRRDAALIFPQVIEGKFLTAAAPTFPHHDIRSVYERTRSVARGYGFAKMPAFDHFHGRWCAAYVGWYYDKKGDTIPELGSAAASWFTEPCAAQPAYRARVAAGG